MADVFRLIRGADRREALDRLLAVRAAAFLGRRYTCPCCGWKLRAFTRGGASMRTRHHGYCPRCNSKARHRRDWLYLRDRTDLFSASLRLLHISPKYSLSRRLSRMDNLRYVAGDLEHRPHVSMRFDVSTLPLRSGTFDCAVCIHVLEHVERDRHAIAEIYRVLKPGGWALITVPVRLDQPTFEDATIMSPEGRMRAFGETDHVRFYGSDFVDRLESCGFTVEIDRAESLDEATKDRYGLLEDENVFFCRKPAR